MSALELIKQRKKAWIQEKSKEELITIANDLAKDTIFDESCTIDEVRRYLREYIVEKKQEGEIGGRLRNDSVIMSAITGLEVFKGLNWKAYQQQFECFVLINDIPKEKKVPLLITKLSTEVYELLTTLCVPTLPVHETYENICQKLDKYYHPIKNKALHQAEFRKRCQKPNESIEEYIVELKKLSKNCEFKNLNEELKERLLNGAYRDAVKFELLKEADKSLELLINIGKTTEIAYKLAFNHEKEQEQTQMFQFQRKKYYKNRSGGVQPNSTSQI